MYPDESKFHCSTTAQQNRKFQWAKDQLILCYDDGNFHHMQIALFCAPVLSFAFSNDEDLQVLCFVGTFMESI